VTFRNNTFLKNPNHEYLLAGGHNFVKDKNTMTTIVWERNNGFVFKDNTLKKSQIHFDLRQRTGYPRIRRPAATLAGPRPPGLQRRLEDPRRREPLPELCPAHIRHWSIGSFMTAFRPNSVTINKKARATEFGVFELPPRRRKSRRRNE
jgi:hypothetical protein